MLMLLPSHSAYSTENTDELAGENANRHLPNLKNTYRYSTFEGVSNLFLAQFVVGFT